jgi:streptogramin lyase
MTAARSLFLMMLTVIFALAGGGAACTSTGGGEMPADASTAMPDGMLRSDATGAADAGPLVDTGIGSPDDTGVPSDAGTTSSASIGPAGGTLALPLGATLAIPAGALSTPTLVTLTPIPAPANATVVGAAFEVDPPGLVFAMPVQLTLAYDPGEVPDGAAASSLAIEQSIDTGAAFTALSSTADTVGHTLSAFTVESGQFAPIVVTGGALFVTTAMPLAAGMVGAAYSASFAATGGTPPYSWSFSAGTPFPPGLAVAATGVMSGTPSTAGGYSFFVRVADSDAHVTQAAFTMTVNPFSNPVPVLISLSPAITPQGTAVDVTITGTDFLPGTTAQVAGSAVTTTYVSATQLIVVLDASVVAVGGSYLITAANPAPGGGASNALPFTVVPNVENPVPAITTLTPSLAPLGSPDTQVTLVGANFMPTSTVLANGGAIVSSYVSASQFLALIPAVDLTAAGFVAVTVQNPAPGGGSSNAATFTVLAAGAGVFTEFPLLAGTDPRPMGITAGSDGALWFAETETSNIGRVTTAGALTEFPVPTTGPGDVDDVTLGPDGALWFTEISSNNIARLTTAGALTEFPVPTAGSGPEGITSGPDGALWFTDASASGIGRVTTTGAFTEYTIPTASSGPEEITSGPDGALWFTEADGNKIGRVTTAGAFTEFPLPTAGSSPDGITSGPDGALWFTEDFGNRIGRITTAGAITELTIPTAGAFPRYITSGPDGALWFGETSGNNVGRVTTSGVFTEFPVPTTNSGPMGITSGPDGALWFTEYFTDKIGRITP